MAFITDNTGNVISFADFFDVNDIEQRVFEANEINFTDAASPAFSSLEEYVDYLLQKSTDRILLKMKASDWWRNYTSYSGASITQINDLPSVDPNRVLARQQDFTDMTVYYCLKEYLLPKVADFGVEESAEVAKIKYYENKFSQIFGELLAIADWYDANDDGTVEDSEKLISFRLNRRTRGRKFITRIQ